VAAAVVDARSSRATAPARGLYLNMAISVLAGVGLDFAATSDIAGTSFILQAGLPNASLVNVAGYATLGALFFLVSALHLGRGR
jgi:hypothetical protein